MQKVRAIFYWIASHIAYDMDRETGGRKSWQLNDRDTTYDSRPLNDRVAYQVLKKRKAVCDGYARLFKSLCDFAGITSAIITGYARSEGDPIHAKFIANHTWNAVYVDSMWRLLDVTWASGYISLASPIFVAQYDDHYFLTPPERFIHSHFPDDLQWTLLSNPPALKEFAKAPFKPMAFMKYSIASYQPASGIIEAHVGDTIAIHLKLSNSMNSKRIAPGFLPDALPSYQPDSWVFLKPSIIVSEKRLSYTYIIPSTAIQWLNIVYNDDVVLRYKMEVR